MFNYTSANKANKKRIKKLQKRIDKSGVDKPDFKMLEGSKYVLQI